MLLYRMHSDLEFKVVKPEPDVTTGIVCCAVIFTFRIKLY